MKTPLKLRTLLAAAAIAASASAAAQETTLSAVLFVPKNTTFGEIFVRHHVANGYGT